MLKNCKGPFVDELNEDSSDQNSETSLESENSSDSTVQFSSNHQKPIHKGSYPCPNEDCDKKFKTKQSRRDHIKIDHLDEVLCPYDGCLWRLKSSSYEKHLWTIHEKRYPNIPCPRCGKSVHQLSMSSHKKRCATNGARKFRCTRGNCKSTFITKWELDTHYRKSHDPKIDCPVENCTAKVRPGMFTRHMREVHMNRKRKYKKVGEFSSDRLSIDNYEVDPSGGATIFMCQRRFCKLVFENEMDRDKHMENEHPIAKRRRIQRKK